MNKLELGATLEGIRKKAGFSIVEIAERTGIDRRTISRIEKGAISARYEDVEAIANAIGKMIYIKDEELPELTAKIVNNISELKLTVHSEDAIAEYFKKYFAIELRDSQIQDVQSQLYKFCNSVEASDERDLCSVEIEYSKSIMDIIINNE